MLVLDGFQNRLHIACTGTGKDSRRISPDKPIPNQRMHQTIQRLGLRADLAFKPCSLPNRRYLFASLIGELLRRSRQIAPVALKVAGLGAGSSRDHHERLVRLVALPQRTSIFQFESEIRVNLPKRNQHFRFQRVDRETDGFEIGCRCFPDGNSRSLLRCAIEVVFQHRIARRHRASQTPGAHP